LIYGAFDVFGVDPDASHLNVAGRKRPDVTEALIVLLTQDVTVRNLWADRRSLGSM